MLNPFSLFRNKVRTKMQRSGKKKIKFKREDITSDKAKLADYHCGILGLCAFVEVRKRCFFCSKNVFTNA